MEIGRKKQVHEERKMDQGNWEMIPTEILENILLHLPTYQLPLYEPWVCKRWTDAIIQPRYWVHKLKKHGLSIDDNIWSALQEFNNDMVSCLYYASLYQEHCTQRTPILDLVLRILTDKVVTDESNNMLMASGVLVCRECSHVNLHLLNENRKGLSLLLKLIEARDLVFTVKDDYAFWNFSPCFNYLQFLKGSGDEAENLREFRGRIIPRLRVFRGCLPTLKGLPSSMTEIKLSIGVDDQNVAIDPGFSRISQFKEITLHFKAGTDISNLSQISVPPGSYILVSGLEESHIFWMTEFTKKYLNGAPPTVVFFNYQLDLKSSENLFNSMAKTGLKYLHILCSSPTLSSDSEYVLDVLFSSLWPILRGDLLHDADPSLYDNLINHFQLFNSDDDLISMLISNYDLILPGASYGLDF